MFKDILKTLKINHYIKNLVVIVPLIFSMNLFNLNLLVKTGVIFLAFCCISSSVYIFNDLIDIKKDKLHPIKKNRPIPSGKISKTFAILLGTILFVVSVFLSALLNPLCLFTVIAYFILNIFYSLYLKNISLIDAACIAIGFILRIVAGCFAINVIPSALVIIMTFFISMFFTFAKRKLEFQLIEDNSKCRKSIRNFDINILNQFILINAILSISFYFTYVLDEKTIARAGSDYLYITVIPFTLIIFRLLFLINTSKIADDPILFIEKDQPTKLLFVFYFIVLAIVLTLLKGTTLASWGGAIA